MAGGGRVIRHEWYLAWNYLAYHKARTVTLVACLSLIGCLPAGLHHLLQEGERQMTQRAESTPLLLAARGSSVDITLAALYYNGASPPGITAADADTIQETGWADVYPIFSRFRVRGYPLVGVTLDYFDYRGLLPVEGQNMAMLGECVLGSDAAEALGLHPGDSVITTPENLFDLAGVYPLKLHVVGVLGKTHTPDDQAIFIDLQTSWVIEGLGHGHAEQKSATPEKQGNVEVTASLLTYTEITEENIESFHFHGDTGTYPITAAVVVPHDQRSSTLLKGRYLDDQQKARIIEPPAITRGLLDNIFRISTLFNGVILLVSLATLMALGLVFSLSLRLRRRELDTIFLLGCSRFTVMKLVTAELLLLMLASAALGMLLLYGVDHYAGNWVRTFLLP